MQAILANQWVIYAIMAILVFALTQGLKWVLVKPWTRKIKNEKVRKGINTIIYFFPYVVGIGLEIAFCCFVTKQNPNLFMGAVNGGAAHSVHALKEHLISLYKDGNGKSIADGKSDYELAVEQLVMGVVEDNKVDGNDCPKLKAFMDKVK